MSQIIKKAERCVFGLEKLKKEMFTCNQDRTFYQLEKFVVNQHQSPGRQYLQIMTEIRLCYSELKRLLLDVEEANLDCEEALTTQAKCKTPQTRARSAIQLSRAQLKLENLEFHLDVKVKEFYKLMTLKDDIKSYSMEEIEAEEKEYYENRLTQQALESKLQAVTGIPVGELRAQVQAGMIKLRSEVDPSGKEMLYIDRILQPNKAIEAADKPSTH